MDSEEDYLRSVAESFLPLLLAEQDHVSTVFRLLMREVVTCRCVRPRLCRASHVPRI